jgi:hypothetical protein
MDALILACIGLSLLLAGFFTGIEVAFISANKISIDRASEVAVYWLISWNHRPRSSAPP